MTPEERAIAVEAARQDLYAFTRWMFLQRRGHKWMRGWHHPIICKALERVYRGECKRLIVNIPPRYSKSEIAVLNFIAWSLGKAPDSEYIHTSYSARLAVNNSWQIRDIVQSDAYREIFPGVALRQDTHAKDEWRTTAGGLVYAVGAGGTITGYGAGKFREGFGGFLSIDDPIKSDEARSDVIRANCIDWFRNTLESRKNSPHTPTVLIMQRLHEMDLSGWLLAGGNGEQWEHVCLPALQPDGTALWPEKHTVEDLLRMREASPYAFAGQYQQQPAPPEGNIFKPERLEIVEAVPEGTRFVRGWDLASTVDGDWTVGALLGRTPSGRWIVADLVRLRGGPEDVEYALLNTARRDGRECRVSIPQDPGQAGKAQIASMTRLLQGFAVSSSPVTGDKVTRAEPFAAQANVGNVLMLKAEWNAALMGELRLFPNAAHDDIVDALSLAFASLSSNAFGLLDFMRGESERARPPA